MQQGKRKEQASGRLGGDINCESGKIESKDISEQREKTLMGRLKPEGR